MQPVPVPGHPGIYADHGGCIYEERPEGLVALPISSTSQYDRVSIGPEGRKKRVQVHVLMAITFLDLDLAQTGCSNGHLQVDHIDGNKRNNRLSNLEVVTKQENLRRAKQAGAYSGNGWYSKGKPKPTLRRFTPEQVARMKELREAGLSYRAIASEFGCDHKAVYNIIRGTFYQQ